VHKIFLLLSGENPTLPQSEVESILNAEGFKYQVLERLTQVLRVETETECINPIKYRSAMTRVCGLELMSPPAEYETILKEARNIDFNRFLKEGQSFVVRVKRVRGSSPNLNGWILEQKLGEIILKRTKGSKVNLKNPDKTFFGILTDERFIFGLKLAEIRPKAFLERGPRRRLFFHPTAMPAKLARCMVNLAQPKGDDIVLDPFCGTGSLLLEAGLMGYKVLGIDVKRYMIEGCMRNLLKFGIHPLCLIVGDARRLPIGSEVDCVVTDPPYGLSATTLGLKPKNLYEEFLYEVTDRIKRGNRICLAAPKRLGVSEIGEEAGLRHIESHFIYVHKRLTREIAIFKRE